MDVKKNGNLIFLGGKEAHLERHELQWSHFGHISQYLIEHPMYNPLKKIEIHILKEILASDGLSNDLSKKPIA